MDTPLLYLHNPEPVTKPLSQKNYQQHVLRLPHNPEPVSKPFSLNKLAVPEHVLRYLHNPEPVTEPFSQRNRQIPPVDLSEHVLRLVVAIEVGAYFRPPPYSAHEPGSGREG